VNKFLFALALLLPFSLAAQEASGSAAVAEASGSAAVAEASGSAAVAEASGSAAQFPDSDLNFAAQTLLKAHQGGSWLFASAGLVMLLIWFLRYLKPEIPSTRLPIIAAVCGILVSVAQSIALGSPLADALVAGLLVSTSAGGLWSILGKKKK
jgi:hypothetical protein